MIEEPLFTMHGHTNIMAGLEVVLGSNRVITADVEHTGSSGADWVLVTGTLTERCG